MSKADIPGLGRKAIVARGSKVSHYFRMWVCEFCRGPIVAYNLTDDESTMKFSYACNPPAALPAIDRSKLIVDSNKSSDWKGETSPFIMCQK